MRQMPKVREDLKTKFQNDQIEDNKLNYLQGGDGGGSGDDDGAEGSTGPINP